MMDKSIIVKNKDKITSFDIPRQVKFYDSWNNEFATGIGYQDFIICGCCGGIFNLEDLYNDYETSDNIPENPILVYNDWVDLTDTIIGE